MECLKNSFIFKIITTRIFICLLKIDVVYLYDYSVADLNLLSLLKSYTMERSDLFGNQRVDGASLAKS